MLARNSDDYLPTGWQVAGPWSPRDSWIIDSQADRTTFATDRLGAASAFPCPRQCLPASERKDELYVSSPDRDTPIVPHEPLLPDGGKQRQRLRMYLTL